MKIEFHPQARIEAVDAKFYIDAQRQGYGVKFSDEMDRAVELIARNPRMWGVRQYGFRRYLTKRFKYQVWYKEIGELIYIIAVHHSSRRPGYWKKRISDEQR